MALKLTVISEQCDTLGARVSIVLGVGGGGIGRAHDNDWVLPDPERYLSAHHARVSFHDSAYYIEDTSTNGVYLNHASTPLGRRGRHALHDGDELRLGEYRVRVSIDTEPDNHAEASAVFPIAATGAHGAGNGSLRGEFNVGELFSTDSSPSRRLRPVDAFGQLPPNIADTGMRAFDNGQRSGPQHASASTGTGTGTARVLIPAAARRALRTAAQETVTVTGTVTAFQQFCRGAGIDAARVPADLQARALHLAGLLLREALAGLKGLALRQHEVRSEYHIRIASEDLEHAALQGLPVEDLLIRLFVAHDQHELDAVQWLRNTLGIARRHEVAAARAIPAALAEYIALLGPPQPPTDGSSGTATAAAAERFRTITEMSGGRLPHLFAEAFARVFATEFKRQNGSDSRQSPGKRGPVV